jgi:5-methylthioadenosine/S-adenosylhomocysteine deaminase
VFKLIRNAHVLTLDSEDTEYESADILINGSIIEAIGPDLELPHAAADSEIIDARGMLAMPGLINAHFHSTSAFMKGALEGLHLEPYMLYEAPIEDRWETKRIYYLRSMITAIDMLKIGITSVRDDAHFFSHPTPDLIDGIFEAFQDAGMRASVGLGISNVPELEKLPFLRELVTDSAAALLPDAAPKGTNELLGLYQSVTERWHGAGAGRLNVHGSCSAPQRVTPEYLRALSDFCSTNDMSLDMHMLETKTQRMHGDLVHGKSFVRYVNDLGALTDNTVLIHCVWVDDQDMDLIAAANSVVAHNPVSNLRLGSGVMPFNAITNRGIDICLGTDEPSVEELSNLWINAKTGALLQKISDPDYDNWPTAAQFITAMCNGGARAMRQSGNVGSLEPGKQADIILLDLNSASFTPRNDLSRYLVYAETGSSVRLTMVAGNVVFRDGDFLLINEDDIKAEINAFWPDYRHSCDRANEKNIDLINIYKAVCKRSAEVDVGFSRWLDLH